MEADSGRLAEGGTRKGRERDLAGLATLAHQMQPVIAVSVNTDIVKYGANDQTAPPQ
jgi:hypothetical protein